MFSFRPVAGYINICPHSTALGEAEHLRVGVLSTIKHEILHALVGRNSFGGVLRLKVMPWWVGTVSVVLSD